MQEMPDLKISSPVCTRWRHHWLYVHRYYDNETCKFLITKNARMHVETGIGYSTWHYEDTSKTALFYWCDICRIQSGYDKHVIRAIQFCHQWNWKQYRTSTLFNENRLERVGFIQLDVLFTNNTKQRFGPSFIV